MDDLYGDGTRFTPGDVRFVTASGPFRMEPGDVQEIVVSILWAQGADRFDSVRLLKQAALNTERALPLIMPFDTTTQRAPPPPEIPPRRPDYRLFHYPQPASEIATFDFELPTSMSARLVLYDVLGREVAVVADGPFAEGTNRVTLSLDGLPAGSYFCRLETQVINLARPITVIQ